MTKRNVSSHMFLLLLLCVSWGLGQSPMCSWACSNPTCDAVCEPVCTTPVCTTVCTNPPSAFCYAPYCISVCPEVVNTTMCPACSVQCNPISCIPANAQCEIQCEPISCAWNCRKPLNCPAPVCELQCENYDCQLSSSGNILGVLWVLLGVLLII